MDTGPGAKSLHLGTELSSTPQQSRLTRTQCAVLAALGSQNADKVSKLRAMFSHVSTSAQDSLGRMEVRSWVQDANGIAPTDREVDQLMETMDSDGDGRISFSEFSTYVSRQPKGKLANVLASKVSIMESDKQCLL